MWAKASISSLYELARIPGEAQPVGKADRPHIQQALLVDLPRRAIAEALMRPLLVVQGDEITPIRSRNLRFSTSGIRGSVVLFMSMR
jgi:hypothetical protein